MKLLGLIFMKFCRFAFTYAMNKDCYHNFSGMLI